MKYRINIEIVKYDNNINVRICKVHISINFYYTTSIIITKTKNVPILITCLKCNKIRIL